MEFLLPIILVVTNEWGTPSDTSQVVTRGYYRYPDATPN